MVANATLRPAATNCQAHLRGLSKVGEGRNSAADLTAVGADLSAVFSEYAITPINETTFRLAFGHKVEDQFWFDTRRNLAAHFGAPNAQPQLQMVCLDKRVQWAEESKDKQKDEG
jgi:hypothetical protein